MESPLFKLSACLLSITIIYKSLCKSVNIKTTNNKTTLNASSFASSESRLDTLLRKLKTLPVIACDLLNACRRVDSKIIITRGRGVPSTPTPATPLWTLAPVRNTYIHAIGTSDATFWHSKGHRRGRVAIPRIRLPSNNSRYLRRNCVSQSVTDHRVYYVTYAYVITCVIHIYINNTCHQNVTI